MGGIQSYRKRDIANCILTGYYAAYYNNAGQKARKPKQLIEQLYGVKESPQHNNGVEISSMYDMERYWER